jgi:hypothetical protein
VWAFLALGFLVLGFHFLYTYTADNRKKTVMTIMKTYEDKLQELKLRLQTLEVEYKEADDEADKIFISRLGDEVANEIALLEQML